MLVSLTVTAADADVSVDSLSTVPSIAPAFESPADGGDGSFPPGCSWECYLENYPGVAARIPRTEEAALNNYLFSVGKGAERDCTCGAAADADGRGNSTHEAEKQNFIMDMVSGRNDTDAAEEKEDLESSFPPGCSWECYLANYVHLANRLENTEEAALKHYLNHGIKDGRDCTCHDGQDIADPSLASINAMDETLAQLDFLDDDEAALDSAHIEQLEEEALEDSFPPGCSWECYLANYESLARLPQTEEAALRHYLNHGIKRGRDCSCKGDAVADPSLEAIEEGEEILIQLDFQDDDEAEEEAEELEEQVEEVLEDSFPPGCSWECYLANYKGLAHLPQTEEAALKHYLNHGIKKGRDCSCKGDAVADPSLEAIEEVEQELTQLDFQDDDEAAEEAEELEDQVEEAVEDSFPPGCSWECYLANYENLARLPQTEEAALRHYLNHGIKKGRDCSCKGDAVADPSLEAIEEGEEILTQLDFQDDDNAAEKAEELEEKVEEVLEDSFPPGCSWECYLANYKNLARLPQTEEAALRHYLNHGIKLGRDCSCREDRGDITDPTSEEIEEVEEELIQLDFQDDIVSKERTDELEQLKKELMGMKKSEQATRTTLTGVILITCPIILFLLWRQRRHNISIRNYTAVREIGQAGGCAEGTFI